MNDDRVKELELYKAKAAVVGRHDFTFSVFDDGRIIADLFTAEKVTSTLDML